MTQGPPERLSPPPRLEKVEPAAVAPEGSAGRRRGAVVTLVALTAAIAALVLVFVALPRWLERQQARDPAAPAQPAAKVLEAPETHDTTIAQPSLDAIADRLHVRIEALASGHADAWGGVAWVEVQREMAWAESHHSAGRQAQAAEAYSRAEEQLEALVLLASETVQRRLEEGRQALAAGDSEGARRVFALVDRMAPGNEQAAAGMARADIHDQVFDLIEGAAVAERSGNPERAAEAARRALGLDPSSQPAREILARSRKLLGTRAYSAAMSDGFSAMEAANFDAASAAFERALTLSPNAPEAADGLRRAQIGLRHQAIDGHHRRAEELERSESWQQAAAEYHKVLAVDPGLAFARGGVDRCEERARLSQRLESTIRNPHRLVSDAVLADAEALVVEARGTKPQGPVHLRQVEELARVVAVAATPVEVVFASDSATQVFVHRVKRLGAFDRRTLRLRPGTYVVVGSRPGFRDVRLQVEVTPEGTGGPVKIRCTEGI